MLEEGLANEGRHHLLLSVLHKQTHDKRGIEESFDAYITRAKLIACEVGVFSGEISQLLKGLPPPALRSSLSSSPMGILSRDYCNTVQNTMRLQSCYVMEDAM